MIAYSKYRNSQTNGIDKDGDLHVSEDLLLASLIILGFSAQRARKALDYGYWLDYQGSPEIGVVGLELFRKGEPDAWYPILRFSRNSGHNGGLTPIVMVPMQIQRLILQSLEVADE